MQPYVAGPFPDAAATPLPGLPARPLVLTRAGAVWRTLPGNMADVPRRRGRPPIDADERSIAFTVTFASRDANRIFDLARRYGCSSAEVVRRAWKIASRRPENDPGR